MACHGLHIDGLSVQKCPLAQAQARRPADTYAFVNVNVVPMDSERVIANQTVIVVADGSNHGDG